MKKLKKVLFLLTALSVLLLSAACSGSEDAAETPEPSPTEDAAITGDDGGEGGAYDDFEMDYSGGIDEKGFWEGIAAYDYIEPFDYIGIEIPYDTYAVTDESVQSEIDYILDYYTTTAHVTDRAAVSGDTVNIDYVGSIDGAEFSGGSTGGSGTEVTIGVTQYIDGFLDQLIGHMPGETFDINATFPEDYGSEELNGKAAVFVTTINYISEYVRPELTDEFVAANLYDYGWATVEDLRTAITESLSTTAVTGYIQKHIISVVTVRSIPEAVLKYQQDTLIDYYMGYAASYGMDIESFVTMLLGLESVEALLEVSAGDIENNAVYLLAMQAIAEDLKMEITEIDLQNYFFDLTGSSDYSEYEAMYGRPYLAQAVLSDMVGTYLTENAVFLDA